jgi:hypothetical protein
VGQQSFVYSTIYINGPANQTNSFTTFNHNAFINGDVTGRFDIVGDLHVPQTANVSQSTLSNVGGSVIRGPISTDIPCPCQPSQELNIQALTTYGATHNDNATTGALTATEYANGGPMTLVLPCGRYYLTRINQPHGLNIEFQGRTVLYVDGDMTIGGELQYTIDPGAEVDVFIAGSLSIGADAMLGTPAAPSSVRTYVGGQGAIDLSAATVFGGNLYAPNADVTFHASANLYGSIFARNAIFSGSANVHFDSNIRTAGSSCPDAGMAPDASTGGGGDASTSGQDAAASDSGTGGSGDSGVPPPDAGSTCTSGCQCMGTSGCVIPPGQSQGMCTACVVDTDCCAPEICVFGICEFAT